jgi:putative Holliday junction resolvase
VDVAALQSLITAHEVEQIVIGLPKMLNGEIGIQGQKVQQFAEVLKREVNVPISFWDERLTTVEAGRILSGVNRRGKKRKEVIDQVAAVLILEGYLEGLRNSGE